MCRIWVYIEGYTLYFYILQKKLLIIYVSQFFIASAAVDAGNSSGCYLWRNKVDNKTVTMVTRIQLVAGRPLPPVGLLSEIQKINSFRSTRSETGKKDGQFGLRNNMKVLRNYAVNIRVSLWLSPGL